MQLRPHPLPSPERQIREFLEFLGDAPEPEWGLPEGWGTYISELFTWATGKRITREQAAVCARRKQGKSWEVVPHELAKLGVYCWTWPVPLTLDGIKEANDAAAEENKDLVTNPRGAMKVVMHRRPPLPRASSNPLSSPGGGRDEEAGDELGIAKLLGEMRNSQSQLPGPAEMSNNGQGMIDPIEASAKRHKNHHGGVTLSPAADLSPPAVSPAGGNNVNPVGGEQTQPASVAKPTLDVTTIDYSSLSAIDCWNLATKLINIAGSGQGDSNALETGERIRAIGTTIQAIGLEARSALSDLLPEIPKGYHEILVSLKTLEEKWLALSKRTK